MTPAAMSDDKPNSWRGCANGFGGSQSTETAKTATPSPPSVYATPTKESPLLFEGLTWREFKAVEQLLDRPGYRLSFLDDHMQKEGNALHYERVSSSEEVKGIDLDLLLGCINIVNHVNAIKTFQQALHK